MSGRRGRRRILLDLAAAAFLLSAGFNAAEGEILAAVMTATAAAATILVGRLP